MKVAVEIKELNRAGDTTDCMEDEVVFRILPYEGKGVYRKGIEF